MMKRVFILGILITAIGLGFIFSGRYQAAAVDAPHNLEGGGSNLTLPPKGCTQTCHILHNAQGSQLNQYNGNVALCTYCHVSTTGNTFVLPNPNPTAPGTVGIHHQYNKPYNSLSTADTSPASMFPGEHVLENTNNIICSSCHDVHTAATGLGTQRVYPSVGTALTRDGGSGSGTLVVAAVTSSAAAKAYKIRMVTTNTFRFSEASEGGALTDYWWNGSAWTTVNTGTGRSTGAGVQLNDGANVTVTFSGTFQAADSWKTFYISYPFLRRDRDYGPNGAQNPPTTNNFCRGCHTSRVNTSSYVESGGDGVKRFNHPVGEPLANTYDVATPRDVDGLPQGSSGDTNATNDLRRDASNNIQCWSCHNIHYGDSNALTADTP